MRILLVEDDESVAKFLHNVLTDEHYIVDVASDGRIGWQLITLSHYDLIILDVLLPELDGIEFCRQLRAKKYSMPVLCVTAIDASSKKVAALDAGADDYITKPFESEELLARVRSLLRRTTNFVALTLEWEGLRLEVNSRELTYRNNKLSLTPKEHAMLELFLRNSTQAFSRQAIIDHLWSYSDAPGEETVTSHIKGLRRKLKNVGAPADFIETVYGVGYRLKPVEAKASCQAELNDTNSGANSGANSAAASSPVELRHRRTQTALATLWKSVQCQQTARLLRIERAFDQLQSGKLSREMRESAYRSSHSLTGVLGIFGLAAGSEIAKQIHLLLDGVAPISQDDQIRLGALIGSLRTELDKATQHQESAAETLKMPIVVLVDPHSKISPALVSGLWIKGFTVKKSPHIETLVKMLSAYEYHEQKAAKAAEISQAQQERAIPDVVLQEFSFADLETDTESTLRAQQLESLATLVHEMPALMLLICSDDGSLPSRVRAAQLGDYPFFYNPEAASVARTIELLRSHPSSISGKILAVDDDPDLLQALQARLVQENYQIVTLDKPLKFWETLQKENPDLLLLDISMPQFTGIEMCQAVRQAPAWRHLPIVFFTAHAEPTLQQAAFKAGADNLIEKSLSDAQILAHLNRQMQRSHLQQAIAAAASNASIASS